MQVQNLSSAPLLGTQNIGVPQVSSSSTNGPVIQGIDVSKFLSILKQCLDAAQKVKSIRDRGTKVNLIVGKTGDGKSTFCSWVLGCDYESIRAGFNKRIMKPRAGQIELAAASSSNSSHTTTLDVYQNSGISRHAFLDSPGYLDTRGTEYDLSFDIAFSHLFRSCEINSIIVVLDAKHFIENRYTMLRLIAKQIKKKIGDFKTLDRTFGGRLKLIDEAAQKIGLQERSIFFVINHKEAIGCESVKDFLNNVQNTVNELLENKDKHPSEHQSEHELLGFLSMMHEDNLFLGDPTDPTLRKKINDKLDTAKPVDRIKNKFGGINLYTLANFVDTYFQRILIVVKKTKHVSQLKEFFKEIKSNTQEEMTKVQQNYNNLARKQFTEHPYEEAVMQPISNQFRDLINDQIKPHNEKITQLRQRISDILTNDSEQSKSLRKLEIEINKLNEKINKLNTDELVSFKDWNINETRFPILGYLFGYTSEAIEYENSEKPFIEVKSEYDKAKGSLVADSKPEKGYYKGKYESNTGEEGKAKISIIGRKNIKFKDDIERHRKELESLIDQRNMKNEEVFNLNQQIATEESEISSLNKQLNDQIAAQKATNRAEFDRQQNVQKEQFNKLKQEMMRKEADNISLATRNIAELNTKIKSLEPLEREIERKVSEDKVLHNSLNTNLLIQACQITDVDSLALDEYIQLKIVQNNNLLGEDDFTCPITMQIMRFPVTTSCGHDFERSALLEQFERAARRQNVEDPAIPCPTCRHPTKNGDLRDNSSLQRRINNYIASLYIGDSSPSPASAATSSVPSHQNANAEEICENPHWPQSNVIDHEVAMTQAQLDSRLLPPNQRRDDTISDVD